MSTPPGIRTAHVGSVVRTPESSPSTNPLYAAVTTYSRGEYAIEAEDAVIVSEALFTVTATGTDVFSGAYVPLAVIAAEISQLPAPTIETWPLVVSIVQTFEFDDV